MSDFSEQELCTRYINPPLLPLFDDPESEVFFQWTGTVEAIYDDPGRPDVMLSRLRGVKYEGQLGNVEVERIQEDENSYSGRFI
ncbi:hypothetical protein BJV82DRAFT_224975 [Fennellomyces sp. T-0311]|nr:hypothetical protein BJV82DRAFT_224975 [Fennellomyces sp. T-0311]